jgi:hypothetical protein
MMSVLLDTMITAVLSNVVFALMIAINVAILVQEFALFVMILLTLECLVVDDVPLY